MKTQGFASKFGTLMVLAGSAVGLGNIWKFPYMLGNNGGAAFLMVYLFCVFLLGIPLMVTELAIGRASKTNAVDAFGKGFFRFFGFLGVFTITLILTFYSTIGGWAIAYTYYYLTGSLAGLDANGIEYFFNNLVSHPYEPVIWQFIFMFATGILLVGGVQKGLEKASKIMMPILFVGLIVLAIRALLLPGAIEGLAFMFQPDFSKITASVFLAAMGQAFFSLSLGSAIMVTYGAYLNQKEKLSGLAIKVALSDTFIALIAGIVIFPAVFAFGLKVNAGPSLLFITLPNVFSAMPLGSLWGLVFFLLIVFAALTSSISMLETSVSYYVTHKNYNRKTTVLVCTTVIFLVGVIMTLSQGPLAAYQIAQQSILDFFADISSHLIVLTALGCALFAGWKMRKEAFLKEIFEDQNHPYIKFWIPFVKFFLPILVGVVLIKGLMEYF